ncbi:uncharacterized protein LOC109828452, partial [Asparagus officinalis]
EVFSSASARQIIDPLPQFDRDRSDEFCRLIKDGGRHCLRQLITDAPLTADATSTEALKKPGFLFGDRTEDPAALTLAEEHWLTLDEGALLYIPSIPRQCSFTDLEKQAVGRQMSWPLTNAVTHVQCGYISHHKSPGSLGYQSICGLRPGIMGLDTAPPGEVSAAALTVRNRLAHLGRQLPRLDYRCYGWASSLAKGWWTRLTSYVLGRWERDLKGSGLYTPIRATMYGLPVSCRHFLALLETYMPDSNTFLTSGGELGLALHEMHQVSGLSMGDCPYQEYFPSNQQLECLKKDTPDVYDTLWDLTCHYHTCLLQSSPPAKTKRKISLKQFAVYLFPNLEDDSEESIHELGVLTPAAINELMEKNETHSYTIASAEGAFPAGTKFRSFLYHAQKSIDPRSLLAGYLALWLKKCVVPYQSSDALPLEVLFPAVQLAYGRELSLLPAMVASIHCGLRGVVRVLTQVGSKPSTELTCPKVELPYAYLMAWFVLHRPDLMSAPSAVDVPVPFLQLLEESRWVGKKFEDVQKELRVRRNWEFFKCFPRFSGRYGEELTDMEKPRTNRTALDVGCFRWLVNIRVGYLVLRVKDRCHIEPYLPCRFARQFGYDQLYVGNPSRSLRVEGGLVDGVRAWLWTMVGCTGAQFALPSYKRKPMITFLSCKWFLSADESISVRSLSELESDHLVQSAMMAARRAEPAQRQRKKSTGIPEGEYADIDTDQAELDTGGVADDHGSLASRRAKSKFGGQTSHDRPVGSMRGDPSKRKKIAHKPHVDQRSHGVDSGGFADGEEGFFEEGELPPGPVFSGADNMDCFMQQVCDALRDGSLGIDLNIDLGQADGVDPTGSFSDIPTSGAAGVATEGPDGDGASPIADFEEQGYVPAPVFPRPDSGLLADMLAEQAPTGTVRPLFESDSSTGAVPDSAIASGVFPPSPNTTDLPTRVDIPSMSIPVVTSEPVEPQPEGISAGIGSRPSLYEQVHALLADTNPDGDVFRTDLGFFTAFYNGVIDKLLHRGSSFDQFRRSFSRHMMMMREEGYPDLADSFTADFAALESEIRELRELKAGGAPSFASSQVEDRLTQWHELRSSVGSELRSRERTVEQLMASLARKDTSRAELVSSLDSTRAEIARLKEALERAEESAATISEELVGLERSREWTLDRLGSVQEGLMKLRHEAAEVLNSSEDSVRASLQAEFEQDYMDRLSGLESHILSRRLPSD